MKNVSLILNLVLLVAVAVLYYLHFQRSGPVEPGPLTSPSGQSISTGFDGIVFVNSDSLLNEYTFFKRKKVEFEEHQDKIKNELRSEQEKLQKQADDYQQQASMMTELQRKQIEEDLMSKQQKLMARKDELMNQLDEEQTKSTEEVHSRINDFLKLMNRDKKFIYVLGYQKGGGILYADENRDITATVIDGLNKSYELEIKK